jgi:hypothetical protein
MAKYVPSGKVGGAGVVMSVGFGLVAAAVSAVAFHFVGRLFYLVLLFPLVWGLVIGAATAAGVRTGKCRNAAVGFVAGLVAAVASVGLFQMLENRHVHSAVLEAVGKEAALPKDVDVYDEFLRQKHGGTGFMAHLSARAEMGMNISRAGRGGIDNKPMISGAGMYVYWFIEFAIIAGICGLMALAAAREPFCEKCGVWYEKAELAGIVSAKIEEARRAIVAKDYAKLPPCVVRTNPGGALSEEKCPKCEEAPVVVKLEAISVDKKGKQERRTIYEELIPADQARKIESAIAGPATPAAGAT